MKTKSKILTSVLCLIMFVFCSFALTACGGDKDCSHKWGEWHVKTNATCTEKGVKERKCSDCNKKQTSEIDVLGHDWEEATCTTPKTCDRCSETEGTTIPHRFTEQVVKAETLKSVATCTSPAVYYKSCLCGCHTAFCFSCSCCCG